MNLRNIMLSIKSSLRKARYSLMSSIMLYIVPVRVPEINRRHTLNSEEKEGTSYSGGRCGRLFHGHKFPSSCYIVPSCCPLHPEVESIFPSLFLRLALWLVLMNRLWQKWFGVSCKGPATSAFTLLECFWHVKTSVLAHWWPLKEKDPTTSQHQPPAARVGPSRTSWPQQTTNWLQMYESSNTTLSRKTCTWAQLQLPTHRKRQSPHQKSGNNNGALPPVRLRTTWDNTGEKA